MIKKVLQLVGFLSVLTALFLFFTPQKASANATHNIRGWAYNTTYSYISFNCLDDGYAGRFPFTFPFLFNIAPCTYNQHGVNLDANGNFSGEAWNSVLGFIDFSSASSTPSDAFRTHCNGCLSGVCSACYDEVSREVFGYMRVRTTGEWIKLDGLAVPTQITNYLDPLPGIFSGYASSTFGAISFNCTNDDSCGSNPYEVKIGPLEIRQMTTPNWGASEACSQGANKAVVKWNLRSGVQSSYQVIVSSVNSTSTGVLVNSGKVDTSANQFLVSGLNYNQAYYWWLRLWDDQGVSSPWRQFNTQGTKDLITTSFAVNADTRAFTSYKHEFPRPIFTWSPEEIVIATSSNSFISSSNYYNSSNVMQPCSGSLCSFQWQVANDPLANIFNPTSASTSIMFTKATSTIITLTSTDPDNYNCSTSTILNVNYSLPTWKEIKP